MNNCCFSSSSSSKFHLFYHSQNQNALKFHLPFPFRFFYTSPSHSLLPPLCSHESSFQPSLVLEKPEASTSSPKARSQDKLYKDDIIEEIENAKKSLEKLPVVRRPVMETPVEGEEEQANDTESSNEQSVTVLEEQSSSSLFSIDAGLSRFARKMPIFEPDRVESTSGEKILKVNLDLALYKAKLLARNFQYAEAEKILQKVIASNFICMNFYKIVFLL